LFLSAGCGKPMFDNAGSQNSLLEDREARALENGDYEGHSLAMLNRIAGALDSARGTPFCAGSQDNRLKTA
jgi:hypothetical protein